MSGEQKSQFENTSGGYVGVVTINAKGEPTGIALAGGDTVWLSEREQALTAEAPRHETDNPFVNGSLTLKVSRSDVPTVRPIGDDQDAAAPPAPPERPADEEPAEIRVEQQGAEDPLVPEETGSAPPPEGEPVLAAPEPKEEIATPEARRAEKPEAAADTTGDREAGIRPSASPHATAADSAPDPASAKSTD